jgi:hypothetical protein
MGRTLRVRPFFAWAERAAERKGRKSYAKVAKGIHFHFNSFASFGCFPFATFAFGCPPALFVAIR